MTSASNEKSLSKLLILSLGRRGSSVVYGKEIVNRFDRKNIEVWVSRFSEETNPERCKKVYTYRNKVEFILATTFLMPLLQFRIMWRIIKGQYEAVYSPYFHLWNPFLFFVFRLFRKPVISTIHDGIIHPGDGFAREQRFINSSIEQSTSIIYLTKFVKESVDPNLNKDAEIAVIPHGLLSFNKTIKRPRRMSHEIRLLFLGRVNRYKGVELLTAAVEQIPKVDYLTIAGKSNYEINQSKNEKFRWKDEWLSEGEMQSLLNEHELLILPYTSATQSGVISIGIANAIPMVITDVGGLREQLQGKGALFCQPNEHDLRSTIEQLINDPTKYEELSNELIQLQKTIDWKTISSKVERFIEQALTEKTE